MKAIFFLLKRFSVYRLAKPSSRRSSGRGYDTKSIRELSSGELAARTGIWKNFRHQYHSRSFPKQPISSNDRVTRFS